MRVALVTSLAAGVTVQSLYYREAINLDLNITIYALLLNNYCLILI